MKDPVLAQQIEVAGAFVAEWNALFDRAARAREAGPAAPGDAAAEFLAARNALVQRYPELMTALEIPVHSDDEVMQLLGRLNSLAAAVQMPEPQWKKLLEVQGHAEVQLRGMLGALEGRRRGIETLNRPRILLLRALGSWPFKLLALVAAILALFIALKAAGV